MVEAYKKFFRNYTNFSGRTSRSDYWLTVVANMIVGFILGFICGLISGILNLDSNIVSYCVAGIYELIILIPALAMLVRRLHDINKSGWYYLMILIPLAGPIIVLIYLCTASVNDNNQYGPEAE